MKKQEIVNGIIVVLICCVYILFWINLERLETKKRFHRLRIEAKVIMNETQVGANTRKRIGNMYLDIIDQMEIMQDQIDSLKSIK